MSFNYGAVETTPGVLDLVNFSTALHDYNDNKWHIVQSGKLKVFPNSEVIIFRQK